ncbi:uncharacterized protein [Lolium perenne]|jgi:hypothetical protein|uniref:uncharacterized protein n=1 Tax=Lolium perenne TaxID=4522 RepID=UPI003A9948C2
MLDKNLEIVGNGEKAWTTITVGNGEKARFWKDQWLNGQALGQLAPDVFALVRRKGLTVKEAMSNNRWMRGLQRISTQVQLDQFVELWTKIQQVRLYHAEDSIKWNLTVDGVYSAGSGYEAQFHGRCLELNLEYVWKIRAEA